MKKMKRHSVKKWCREDKDKSYCGHFVKQWSVEEKKRTKAIVGCCCQRLAKSYYYTILFCKENMDEAQECDSEGIFQFILFYMLRFVVIQLFPNKIQKNFLNLFTYTI